MLPVSDEAVLELLGWRPDGGDGPRPGRGGEGEGDGGDGGQGGVECALLGELGESVQVTRRDVNGGA